MSGSSPFVLGHADYTLTILEICWRVVGEARLENSSPTCTWRLKSCSCTDLVLSAENTSASAHNIMQMSTCVCMHVRCLHMHAHVTSARDCTCTCDISAHVCACHVSAHASTCDTSAHVHLPLSASESKLSLIKRRRWETVHIGEVSRFLMAILFRLEC